VVLVTFGTGVRHGRAPAAPQPQPDRGKTCPRPPVGHERPAGKARIVRQPSGGCPTAPARRQPAGD